jgi:cytochrome b561
MAYKRAVYDTTSKIIHWLSAIIIIALLAAGFYMEDLAYSDTKMEIYGLHKSFGITLFILVVFRLIWRSKHPVDKLESTTKSDHIKAKAVHGLLYMSMILMPVSGVLMSWSGGYKVAFFSLTLPNLVSKNETLHQITASTHEWLGIILCVLILAHVGAALFHHFIKKDDTIKRMS